MNAATRRNRGFALIELAVASAVAAMLAVWAASVLVNRIEDARAEATGRWLLGIRSAAERMLAQALPAMSEGETPAGYADPHAPTLAELRAAGHLAAGFPARSPFGQPADVRILRQGACPGAACRFDILVTTLASAPGAAAPDPSQVGQVLLSADGLGGAVHPQAPGRLRGATFDLPNPPAGGPAAAYPVGTVAVHGSPNAVAALHDRFVRIRDTRDPDLQGGLSVREDVAAQGGVRAGGNLSAGRDVLAGRDVTAAGRVAAQGRLETGEYLRLGAAAVEGAPCASAGLFSRSAAGNLLSCQSGRWAQEGSGFGGAYSHNNRYGCQHYSGVSSANPRTGACSCPPGHAPVIVSAGGRWTETEGWTTGYVCVR